MTANRWTFDELLSAVADEKLTAEQRLALSAMLEESPQKRRLYVEYLHLHTHLRREGSITSEGLSQSQKLEAAESPHNTIRLSRSLRWAGGLAAAIVLSVVGIWAGYAIYGDEYRPTDVQLPDRPFLAVVTQSFGAEWGDGQALVEGTELYKGQWFELTDGLVELNVGRQARVIIESPSRIGMVDSQQLSLEYGTLAAEIFPDSSGGLSVATPLGRAVDYGTRFVLRSQELGNSQLDVLEGAVIWCTPDQDVSEGQHVEAGERILVSAQQVNAAEQAIPSKASELLRDTYATRLLDAGPRVYLPFAEESLKQLTPHVGRESSMLVFFGDLKLSQSPFAEAGSHADHALDLDSSAESHLLVRRGMEPAIKAGAYTIMLWVKADRIAQQNILAGTSVLRTKHRVGPQLRMHEDGRLIHYVYTSGPAGKLEVFQPSSSRLQVGRWYHVAMTAESDGVAELYVNGNRVGASRELQQPLYHRYHDIRLGGASGRPGVHQIAAEPFTGEVDELAVFDRVLSREEIRYIYRGAELDGGDDAGS